MSGISNRHLALGVASLGTLMAALDMSIVNVAIPAIMKDFGSDVHEVEWVVTAYMIGFAALMPLTAWMRLRFGVRRTYLASLAVFLFGSISCALSPNLGWLIAARILQSLAAGALTPTGMAIVSDAFAPSERGRALGYWGLGALLGPALGPPLGGLMAQAFGWRSIFVLNIPVGVVAFLLAARTLRKDHGLAPSAPAPFDPVSFLSLTAGIVTLMLFVNRGSEIGWSAQQTLTYAFAACISFVVFAVAALKTGRAVIDLSLFRFPAFVAAAAISAVRSVVLFGTTFLLPIFLQGPRALTMDQSGLVLLPGAVAIGVAMPFAGRAFDRFGARLPAVLGVMLMLAAMLEFSQLTPQTSIFFLVLPTIVRGLGIGLLVTPVAAVAMNTVPPGKEGMASSVLSLIQQVAGSLGITLLSAFFNAQIDRTGQEVASAARGVLAGATGGAAHAPALAALTSAFSHTYLVGAALVGLALMPVFWLPGRLYPVTARKPR